VANEKKKSKFGQYLDEQSKQTPNYIRYEQSLSSYIMNKVITHCTKTIFDRKLEYMKKFNMDRRIFIKVFNLFCSLSFMSILRKLKKSRDGNRETNTEPEKTNQQSQQFSKRKMNKQKKAKQKKKTRNL